MTARSSGTTSAVVTVPNAISLARILLIPLFVWLIVDPDTTFADEAQRRLAQLP